VFRKVCKGKKFPAEKQLKRKLKRRSGKKFQTGGKILQKKREKITGKERAIFLRYVGGITPRSRKYKKRNLNLHAKTKACREGGGVVGGGWGENWGLSGRKRLGTSREKNNLGDHFVEREVTILFGKKKVTAMTQRITSLRERGGTSRGGGEKIFSGI